jgi:hypothetical protein
MTNEVRELFEFVASGGRSVLYNYGNSRAASVQDDVRITKMINGILVSKPAKKITYLDESRKSNEEKEPEITILNDSWERQHSKGASTPAAVNPVREIFDLMNGRFE